MPPRKRYGHRRYVAAFEKHNGNTDAHGQPAYTDSADWDVIVSAWPCELVTTSGGERLRGRQVTGQATHVLFGEYSGAKNVTTDMRAVIGGTTYAVVAAFDSDGLWQEMRVELRREV